MPRASQARAAGRGEREERVSYALEWPASLRGWRRRLQNPDLACLASRTNPFKNKPWCLSGSETLKRKEKCMRDMGGQRLHTPTTRPSTDGCKKAKRCSTTAALWRLALSGSHVAASIQVCQQRAIGVGGALDRPSICTVMLFSRQENDY